VVVMAGSPSRCVPRHNEQRGPEPEFAIPWNPLSTTYLKKPRKLVGAASVSISVDFRGVAQRGIGMALAAPDSGWHADQGGQQQES
jgi:hypothetical protein